MTGEREGRGAGAVLLSSLPDGAAAVLDSVMAGSGLRSRLLSMGLRPGVQVHVVRNRGGGPFVVAVQGCRIVLGRGMAHKIRVVPA